METPSQMPAGLTPDFYEGFESVGCMDFLNGAQLVPGYVR